jgi:hypothetical protein
MLSFKNLCINLNEFSFFFKANLTRIHDGAKAFILHSYIHLRYAALNSIYKTVPTF